jgi:glutathione S-transferase
MVGYGSLDSVLKTLEGALSQREYLAGDSFTAADLFVGAQLGFGLRFGIIEKRPVLVAYAERLAARPAAMRARQTDDALGASRPTA